MEWLEKNWKNIIAVIISGVILLIVDWYIFVKPKNEEITKLNTELAVKKAELEIKKVELEVSVRMYEEAKYISDSLYSEWEKRQVKPIKDIKYENDIKFITTSSSFNERAQLFTDWLNSTK